VAIICEEKEIALKNELTDRKIESYGVSKESYFTIEEANTAHIFGILRNQLYSNKPLAVIREYSTNAWDAHIEAGCPDRPIEVTLPTILNPVFKVRDYGVGLNEDGIMRIFSSYGMSTKRDSNTQVGMLGLGSKSAFCYGNSYEITSFYNGVRSLFTAYLDETNKGKIAKTIEEPTTEPNGIEITVAVKKEDIYTFIQTAKTFFTHFSPRPIFKGVVDDMAKYFDSLKTTVAYKEHKDWKIVSTSRTSQSMLIMGNVAYNLSGAVFTTTDDQKYRAFLDQATIVLYAGIGDVMITASREALEYNDKTKKYIRITIDKIVDSIRHDLEQEIHNAPNLWSARMCYNKLKNQQRWFINLFDIDLKYKGQPITDSYISCKIVQEEFNTKLGAMLKSYGNFDKSRLKSESVSTLVPKDNVLFVLNKNNGVFPRSEITAKIRGAHKANPTKDLIIVDFQMGDKSKEFMSHVEIVGANFVDLASFDSIKVTSTGKSTTITYDRRKCKVFSYNMSTRNRYGVTNSDSWELENDVDIATDGGVYMYINAFVPSQKEHDWLLYNVSLRDFNNVLSQVEALGIKLPVIYGIRDSVDNLHAKWIPLRVYVQQEIEKLITTNKLNDVLIKQDLLGSVPANYLTLVDIIKDIPDGKLKTFLSAIKDLQDKKNDALLNNINVLLKRIKLPVNIVKNNSMKVLDFAAEAQTIKQMYPMLNVILHHLGGWTLLHHNKQELLEYFNLIENAIELRQQCITLQSQQMVVSI